MQLPLLPVLPALPPLPPLPVLYEYSPWFPMSLNPWAWGYYEIKYLRIVDVKTGEMREFQPESRYLWDRQEWADKLPTGVIAWRGLARPAA